MIALIVTGYTFLTLCTNLSLSKAKVLFLLLFLIFELVKTEYLKRKFYQITITILQAGSVFLAVKLLGFEFSFLLPLALSILWNYKEKLSAILLSLLFVCYVFFLPKNIAKDYLFVCIFIMLTKTYSQIIFQNEKKYLGTIDDLKLANIQLSKLKAELLESQQKIEKLSYESQKQKIASFLHDTIGHSLSGLNIQLNALKSILEKKNLLEDERIRNTLNICTSLLNSCYKDLRQFVYSMKSSFESNTNYIKKIVQDFSFCKLDLKLEGDIEKIPSHIFENLMATLKEALVNVSKHSDATFVSVHLSVKNSYVRLYIHDNGTQKDKIKEGIGILSMRIRAKAIGSTINIDNSAGFSIVVFAPLKAGGENTR